MSHSKGWTEFHHSKLTGKNLLNLQEKNNALLQISHNEQNLIQISTRHTFTIPTPPPPPIPRWMHFVVIPVAEVKWSDELIILLGSYLFLNEMLIPINLQWLLKRCWALFPTSYLSQFSHPSFPPPFDLSFFPLNASTISSRELRHGHYKQNWRQLCNQKTNKQTKQTHYMLSDCWVQIAMEFDKRKHITYMNA